MPAARSPRAWAISGQGTVSGDGSAILSDGEVLTGGGYFFAVPPAPQLAQSADYNPSNVTPTALKDGNFSTSITTPSYRSLEQDRAVTLVYNSALADPRPIVAADATLAGHGALPVALESSLNLAGLQVAGPISTSTANPDDPSDPGLDPDAAETLRLALQFDAGTLPTGSYATTFQTTARYDCSRVGAELPGRLLVENQTESPFGSGWTIAGLQSLALRDDGNAVLTDGTGQALFFELFSGVEESGEARELISAPDSVDLDALESDGEIVIFNEVVDLTLQAPLALDATRPQLYNSLGDLHGGSIAAGAVVNSHLIHFDPVGGGNVTRSATFVFQSDILGLLVQDAQLDASDAVLGAEGTAYPNGTPRATDLSNGDRITLSGDLRTLSVTLTSAGGLDQIRVITSGQSDTLAAEGFDENDGGWRVVGDVEIPNYFPTGGNPDGHVQAIDRGTGIFWYWQAPLDFLGDRSELYNSRLSYDLRQSRTNRQRNRPDLILTGAGITLHFDTAYNPLTTWTHYSVHLQEGAGWVLAGTTTPPTASQFLAVLGDLTDFQIRGEFRFGADTGSLDNVIFVQQPPAEPVFADFRRPAGEFSTLTRNDDGSFSRRLTDGTTYAFDEEGRMTAVSDANGNTTSYDYDPVTGALTKITDPAGLETNFAYGPDGLMDSVTDPAGRITTYFHDEDGNLVRVLDPEEAQQEFAYLASGLMETSTDQRGNDTNYTYGFAGQYSGLTFSDGASNDVQAGRVVGLADLASGVGSTGNPNPFVRPGARLATFVDGRGVSTSYQMTEFGTVERQTDVLGREISITIDEDNNPVATTMPNGAKTESEFDDRGNLVVFREASGSPLERVRRIEFTQGFNRISRITDYNNNPPTDFSYDSRGNIKEIVGPDDLRISFLYDDPNCPGLATEKINATSLPEEGSEKFFFDPVTCNLVEIQDPLGNAISFTRDSAGNVIQVSDAQSRVTRFIYDELNRIVKRIDATNQEADPPCGTTGVSCSEFDGAGNIITVTDANANVTRFEYDQRNRLKRQLDPFGLPKTFAYDGNGNLIRTIDRKSQVIEFEYDLANRPIVQRMLPGTSDEMTRNFSYDVMDNPTLLEDDHSVLSFTYDTLNQLKTVSTTGSPFQQDTIIEYEYDANGNRIQMIDPTGSTIYQYDLQNRLIELTPPSSEPGKGPFQFSYDTRGRLVATSLPNNTATETQYDLATRVTSIVHTSTISNISTFQYTSNAVGNRIGLEQARLAIPVASLLSYEYDEFSQVTLASRSNIGEPNETFSYDPMGNRLRRDGQIDDSVYGLGNRLLSDESYLYDYDANGNLISKTDQFNGQATLFHYDAEDRLVRIDFPDQSYSAYRYDGLDRRIEKDLDGEIIRYIYDSEDILLEASGSNEFLAHYSHGPGADNPLLMVRDLDESGTFEATERFYYHKDALGSVMDLTDDSGAVVKSYAYDTFGQIVAEQGLLDNPYTFTARENDRESDLYYYRARYYDPTVGRFLSEDPLGFGSGDLNPYRYVFNNALNLDDPSGQATAIGAGGIFVNIARLIKPLTVLTAAVLATYPCYWTGFDYFDDLKPRFPGGPLINKTRIICRYFCFWPPRTKFKTIEFASQPTLGQDNPAIFPPLEPLFVICPPVEAAENLDDAPRSSC